MTRPNIKPRLLFIALMSCCIALFSCSEGVRYGNSKELGQQRSFEYPFISEDARPPTRIPLQLPWETWAFGRNSNGFQLSNASILKGEELLKQGKINQALDEFNKAKTQPLELAEKEALVLRIASCQLALDQPSAALASMSDYFTAYAKGVEQVNARFALIFAFAYGHKADIPQSLAWFSKAQRSAGENLIVKDRARFGVRTLLHWVPSKNLEGMQQNWSSDNFINSMLNSELRRRREPNYVDPLLPHKARFWESEIPGGSTAQVVSPLDQNQASFKFGALLPLSGPYAKLGLNTQRGIDLAIETVNANRSVGKIEVVYRDSAGDVTNSVASARELINSPGVRMILGPLLQEEAAAVSDVARQNQFPLLTFSKSSQFQPGQGIFRLAPTIESQVESLLLGVQLKLNAKRFVVVSSEDQGSKELARTFKEKLAQFGFELVYDTSYARNDEAALLVIAKELEKYDFDVLFSADSLLSATRLLSALSPYLREKITVMGNANWYNPIELSHSPKAFDGVIFITPFFAESQRELVTRFVANYRAKFAESPDYLVAQGFDAATLAVAALDEQSRLKVSLSQSFAAIDLFDGLTGKIHVNDSGDLLREFPVLEFKQGQIRELAAFTSAQAPNLFEESGNNGQN